MAHAGRSTALSGVPRAVPKRHSSSLPTGNAIDLSLRGPKKNSEPSISMSPLLVRAIVIPSLCLKMDQHCVGMRTCGSAWYIMAGMSISTVVII